MDLIEPKIRPVCDALNRVAGVRTLWSCEGHAFRPSRPYVVFEAPESIALQVHRMIGDGHAGGKLHYWWNMTANFRENGELQWLIEAPAIPSWHYLPIVRQRIDAELLAFAALLKDALA
ncbi:hypothetical protein [Ralstonia pseudosolanacearum]|uniref:hypothetical protein n=1 Tax=Ralstonia pseudosolanacearum TaxID=1310165 RepID=UPI003CEDD5E5